MLEQHYKRVSPHTKTIMLSSFIKMQHLYPELVATFAELFESNSNSLDAEVGRLWPVVLSAVGTLPLFVPAPPPHTHTPAHLVPFFAIPPTLPLAILHPPADPAAVCGVPCHVHCESGGDHWRPGLHASLP